MSSSLVVIISAVIYFGLLWQNAVYTQTTPGNATSNATGGVTVAPTGNATGNATGGVTVAPTGNATGNATGGVTVAPTGNATASPQCPANYCQNGATCRLGSSNCPNGAAYCCRCSANYVGDTCNTSRQSTVLQVFKSSQTFTSDLTIPTSAAFIALANAFIVIAKNTMIALHTTKGVNNVQVNVEVLNFQNGSIFANTSISLANPTGAALPAITTTDVTTALATACTPATCNAIGLDQTYAALTVNPNLCASPTLNVCSANATCTFSGTVNYTCQCYNGFRDDSSGIAGSVCTRICSNAGCNNRGTCKETTGADFTCSCNSGVTGQYCQNGSYRVQQSTAILLISLFLFPLLKFSPLQG